MARRFTVHPTGRDGANALISRWHRHCGPVVVAMDCLELREGARACGVGVLGKPLSAILDDGVTLEVRRTATDGTEHACSAVLGALARAARRRSVLRLVTYTREGESGSSLRGAGWWLDENYHRDWEIIGTRLVHLILPKPARSWSSPSRPRRVATLGAPRFRWWKLLPDACTFDGALRLGAAAGRMHQVSGCPFPYDGPNGRWRSIWGEGYDYPNAVPDRPRPAASNEEATTMTTDAQAQATPKAVSELDISPAGLAKMSIDELRAACRERRLRRYSEARRAVLEDMLLDWKENPPPPPQEVKKPKYVVTCFPTFADLQAGVRGRPCGTPTGYRLRAYHAAQKALRHAYVVRIEAPDGSVEVLQRGRDPVAFLETSGLVLYQKATWKQELASDLGVSHRQIDYWITRERLPPPDLIQRLEAVADRRRSEITALRDQLRQVISEQTVKAAPEQP